MTDVSRCSSTSSAAFLSFSVDVTAAPEGQDASHADTLTGCRFTPLVRDGSGRRAAREESEERLSVYFTPRPAEVPIKSPESRLVRSI